MSSLSSDNWKKTNNSVGLEIWEHITGAKLILSSYFEKYTNPKRTIYFWSINLETNGIPFQIIEERLEDYQDYTREDIVFWNKNTRKQLSKVALRFRRKSNNWKLGQFTQYGKKKQKRFE